MALSDKHIKQPIMIHLTRLNKTAIVLNSDLIEHMEVTPDTVICLTSGQKIRVQEGADEIIRRVLAWRHLILLKSADNPSLVSAATESPEGGSNGGGFSA